MRAIIPSDELSVARRPAKLKPVADWQISKIGKVGRYIGTVQAADAEAAPPRGIRPLAVTANGQRCR